MNNQSSVFFLIITIGICTLALRAVFLFSVPSIIRHPLVKRGMDAVPAAMLVALVVPFTLFDEQGFSVLRPEVFAIVISIPLILLTRKFAYGLVIALITYLVLLLL